MSRRLDPDRPLWEMYFVEGLEGGRVALLSKSHQILVDGISTVDLGQVLLDVDPGPRQLVLDGWRPAARADPHQPGGQRARRVRARPAGRDRDAAQQRRGVRSHPLRRRRHGRVGRGPVLPPPDRPESPFNIEPSAQRRLVCVRTSLKDYRKVRRVHGGTVNDVILATLSGAIRTLADDPVRVRRRRSPAACPGPDERDRRGARADLARLPGGRPPRRPADRRGLARRTPPPGVLRAARPQRDRQGGRGRPDRGRRGLRAHHLPLARARGWRSRRRAAASTW